MKITGKRSFSLSQLERVEMLIIRPALNEYYQMEMHECANGGITAKGEIALRILNNINDFFDAPSDQ